MLAASASASPTIACAAKEQLCSNYVHFYTHTDRALPSFVCGAITKYWQRSCDAPPCSWCRSSHASWTNVFGLLAWFALISYPPRLHNTRTYEINPLLTHSLAVKWAASNLGLEWREILVVVKREAAASPSIEGPPQEWVSQAQGTTTQFVAFPFFYSQLESSSKTFWRKLTAVRGGKNRQMDSAFPPLLWQPREQRLHVDLSYFAPSPFMAPPTMLFPWFFFPAYFLPRIQGEWGRGNTLVGWDSSMTDRAPDNEKEDSHSRSKLFALPDS